MDLSEYMANLDTKNEFQFFNFEDLSNMNKVFDYYKKYAEQLLALYNSQDNIYNQKIDKVLNWQYVWNSSLNAGSREYRYMEQLDINEGTIFKVYAFFYEWVNRSTLFENSEKNIVEIRINLTEHSNGEELSEIIPMSTSLRKNNIAEYLAKFAIEIIVAHEVGHLYNGHTEYFFQLQHELETDISEQRRKQCLLDLRTLEYDADTHAVNRILEEAIHLIDTKDKILQSGENVFNLLQYAIHGLCFLMRIEKPEKIEQYMELDHPHPISREMWMIGALKQHFNYLKRARGIKYDHDFENSSIFWNAENTMCAVKQKDTQQIKDIFQYKSSILENSCKELEQNWPNVAKYIKTSSRLPIEGIDYN